MKIKKLTDSKGLGKAKSKKINCKSLFSPIGIDIGSAQIKIVQLRQRGGILSFVNRSLTTTPQGTFSEGRIIDQEKLIYKLGQLQKKTFLKGNRAILCLGPEAHYLRLIDLPPLSNRDLQKTLPWEVAKHFPLQVENAVYDCCQQSFGKAGGNGSIKHLLAAADVNNASALTVVAEQAGFKPVALEVSPLSILRVEALKYKANPGYSPICRALLDIGYRSSTLLITEMEMLQYSRHLRIGVFDFIKELASADGSKLEEAQRCLYQQINPALVNKTNSALLLAAQVTESISYYFAQCGSGATEPDLLTISGGGAAIPGLPYFLQSKLAVKVQLQQLPAFAVSKSGKNPNSQSLNAALYTTAFGLALRGWLK